VSSAICRTRASRRGRRRPSTDFGIPPPSPCRTSRSRSRSRPGTVISFARTVCAVTKRSSTRWPSPVGASGERWIVCTVTPAPDTARGVEGRAHEEGLAPWFAGTGRDRGSHRAPARAPHEHLRAQAGGAAAVRPDGRGDRGHHGPQGVGPDLALPVRLVPEDLAVHRDEVRRPWARGKRHRAGRAEARSRPLAQADLRGLRVRARLPRPPGPFLRALRPGADPARDGATAARGMSAMPRLEPRALPLRREGRRPEGVRAGLGYAVPR